MYKDYRDRNPHIIAQLSTTPKNKLVKIETLHTITQQRGTTPNNYYLNVK